MQILIDERARADSTYGPGSIWQYSVCYWVFQRCHIWFKVSWRSYQDYGYRMWRKSASRPDPVSAGMLSMGDRSKRGRVHGYLKNQEENRCKNASVKIGVGFTSNFLEVLQAIVQSHCTYCSSTTQARRWERTALLDWGGYQCIYKTERIFFKSTSACLFWRAKTFRHIVWGMLRRSQGIVHGEVKNSRLHPVHFDGDLWENKNSTNDIRTMKHCYCILIGNFSASLLVWTFCTIQSS